jgi:hypothetical protein
MGATGKEWVMPPQGTGQFKRWQREHLFQFQDRVHRFDNIGGAETVFIHEFGWSA